ncbi:MAG: DUF748 domain-containing protein [Sulfuricurvum sp.]|uniref:DUF748 domain-containing protein n=1 Tax=Sulfuricurvum sp. TaxID=2025608 RepID=UPI0025CF614C|nr:DUF748 domain-containing protein [Sulfuricurvum sp.]MBV5321154.1 DUF748 domain-containing protein [Sulfuricurvum sp.]
MEIVFKKGDEMNKKLIFKSVAAAVSTYAIIGFFGVPYLIKNIVPGKVFEATNGGQFSVEKAAFNPFTFHLRLNNVVFKTPQNSDFVALKKFSFNIDPLAYLWKGAVVVNRISFVEPKITIKRDKNGDFNFKWLTELRDDKPKEDEKTEPMRLMINHFALKNGSLSYSDYTDGKDYTLNVGPIGFNLDNIDLRNLSNENGKMRLYATINEGGFVDFSGKIDALEPFVMGGSVAFNSGKLYTPWSYFKDKLPIEVADGTAGFGFDYRFNSNDLNSTELTNLYVKMDKVRIISKENQHNLFALSSLRLDGAKVQPMKKIFNAKMLTLEGVNLSAHRSHEGKIDWLNYIEEIQKAFPSEESDESKTPWTYGIDEIALNNSGIGFVDEVPNKKVAFNLDQMSLNLKGFQSNPSVKNDLTFSSRINEKSTIELKSEIVRAPLSSSGRVNITGLDLSTIDPYIEPSTYASLRRGNLSLEADYEYKPSKTELRGKVALDDWVVNDSRDDSVLLGWTKIGVTPFVYVYPDNRLKVNQLAIDGFYTNLHIDAKKVLNYSTLSKKSGAESNGTKLSGNPFGLDIVKLLLRGSSATFSDMSLPLPFKTYVHDLEGSVLGISTTKDVTTFVKLRGGVDQYGLAKIDGSLNTKDPKKFTDLKVAFDNLELKGYTPYSLEFLGYKIVGGKLFLDLGYKINQGKLNGANRVIIKQIELGEEKAGGSPWPLRLVVALLEDSDGVIDIDLPIEGDVNNPDFKYGKVVWQVIGNLFTKAVTSPFRLLGSMMGIDSDKISSIDFEAGSSNLLPPQLEKLDQITTILSKRPKMALNVYGGWDETQDTNALKRQKLVQRALNKNKNIKIDTTQAMSVELLEDMAEESLDKNELKALKISYKEKYPEEAAYVRHYSAALIEKLIPLQPLSTVELQTLAQQRSTMIRNYLMKTAGFEKRLILKEGEPLNAQKEDLISTRLEIVVP